MRCKYHKITQTIQSPKPNIKCDLCKYFLDLAIPLSLLKIQLQILEEENETRT